MIELHEAGLINVLRTILWVLFFYYAFKFLARLFMPYIFNKAVNKMKEKAEQQYKNQYEPEVKEGETIIDKKPKNNTISNKDVGEYVDYEEVE